MNRSDVMRAVKSRDTSPELLVRRLTHSLGYRFRLHRRNLPGTPDMIFPSRRKAIFVHGCFWHGHSCARGARIPKHNRDYWISKIARNRLRDDANILALNGQGWRTLVLWGCELNDQTLLRDRLLEFLGTQNSCR